MASCDLSVGLLSLVTFLYKKLTPDGALITIVTRFVSVQDKLYPFVTQVLNYGVEVTFMGSICVKIFTTLKQSYNCMKFSLNPVITSGLKALYFAILQSMQKIIFNSFFIHMNLENDMLKNNMELLSSLVPLLTSVPSFTLIL